MSDLHHDDPVQGPCIVTFDGRILELFTQREGGKERMIVGMLHVDVGEPNRKGRRDVKFTCAPGFRSGGRLLPDRRRGAVGRGRALRARGRSCARLSVSSRWVA